MKGFFFVEIFLDQALYFLLIMKTEIFIIGITDKVIINFRVIVLPIVGTTKSMC